MISILLAGTFLPFLHAADTLPSPDFNIELTEAHVCASDEVVHAQLTCTIRSGMRMELAVDNATNAAYAHPLSLAQQVGVLEPGRQFRFTLAHQC
jgi:hypothetical protein